MMQCGGMCCKMWEGEVKYSGMLQACCLGECVVYEWCSMYVLGCMNGVASLIRDVEACGV